MAIPISERFARELIKQRWNSVDGLEDGWIERCQAGHQKIGAPRDRGTIYRWLASGLPNRREDVFGFCSALGVDPLVLIDVENNHFEKIFVRERVQYLTNMATRARLSVFWPLLRPASHWPDRSISYDFYARDWTTFDFAHTASEFHNVYAQVSLRGDPDEQEVTAHRIYYFSYRRSGARDGLWRPYGVVRKRGQAAICISENGDIGEGKDGEPQQVEVDESGAISVETFFGPGPAEFRVACLHPFSAELTVPSKAANALRFKG